MSKCPRCGKAQAFCEVCGHLVCECTPCEWCAIIAKMLAERKDDDD